MRIVYLNMKNFLTALLFTVSTSVYAQSTFTSFKWVTDDLEYISFHKDVASFMLGGLPWDQKYETVKDTLMFVDRYTTLKNGIQILVIDTTKYLIKQSGDVELELILYNSKPHKFVSKPYYKFKNLTYLQDKTLKFNKLHFTASACYGTCPVLNIDIDNKGTYYLTGGEYAEPYKGAYRGVLTARQLDTLNYLLQTSELKIMHTWKQGFKVSDAPGYNFTIYYNDKKLKIKTEKPPLNLVDLVDFLVNSYRRVKLKENPGGFVFKED